MELRGRSIAFGKKLAFPFAAPSAIPVVMHQVEIDRGFAWEEAKALIAAMGDERERNKPAEGAGGACTYSAFTLGSLSIRSTGTPFLLVHHARTPRAGADDEDADADGWENRYSQRAQMFGERDGFYVSGWGNCDVRRGPRAAGLTWQPRSR
jgi:hypothetical protein